jgi:hypothetical protein
LASTSAIAPRNKEKASNPATNKKSGEDSKPRWKGSAPHNNNNNNNSTNEFLSPCRRREEEEEEQGEMGKKEIATTKKKKPIKNLSVNK